MPLNTPYEEIVKFQNMRRWDATQLLRERDPGCSIMVTFDGYLIISPQGEVLAAVMTNEATQPPVVQATEVTELPQAAPEKKAKFFNWPKF